MKNRDANSILRVVIATGVVSISTQLVVIREFLTLFSGNEFIIAITLFNWLVLGGCGTLLARLTEKRIVPSMQRLAQFSFLLCGLGISEIIIIRLLHNRFFIHGLEAGFYPTFAFTFFVSAPYCLLVGFLLPFSLYAIKHVDDDVSPVRVYMADNIGDASGGALFSFVLVFIVTPVKAVFLTSLPLFTAAVLLLLPNKRRRALLLYSACVAALMIICIAFEQKSLERKESRLKFYSETPYGRVEVQEYKGEFSFFRDGVPLFDTKNRGRAEETVHYGLSQVEQVQRILCISASANIFTEIQKYNPERIDYLEIDPAVSDAMFEFSFLKKNKNINVINDDAVRFLNSTDEKYSAVIMDLPSPDTFGLNRFYTKEFFKKVKAHLSEGGVFVYSVKGFENYPEDNQLKQLSSLYATAASCFDHVLVLPFSQAYFILSDTKPVIDIPARLADKGIETSYIEQFYITDLVKFRTDSFMTRLDYKAPVNSDFSPVIIHDAFGHWFSTFNSSPVLFGAVASALFLIYLLFLSKTETILFFTGFSAMAMQMAVIFVFQILFGYIYLKTGMLITVFLFGLFIGALRAEKMNKRLSMKDLFIHDTLIILLMLIFAGAVFIFRSGLPQLYFMIFSMVFAVVCGMQFATGMKMEKGRAGIAAGFFAADLIGAAAGLLVFSLLLLPLLGIFKSIGILCLLKTISLIRYRL